MEKNNEDFEASLKSSVFTGNLSLTSENTESDL